MQLAKHSIKVLRLDHLSTISDNVTFQLGGIRDGILDQMIQQQTPEQQLMIAEAESKAMGSNTENMTGSKNYILLDKEKKEINVLLSQFRQLIFSIFYSLLVHCS